MNTQQIRALTDTELDTLTPTLPPIAGIPQRTANDTEIASVLAWLRSQAPDPRSECDAMLDTIISIHLQSIPESDLDAALAVVGY